MKLTKKQYRKIEHLMPIPRKPPEISNYQFLCALLYMIENGCKWRALPKKNAYTEWKKQFSTTDTEGVSYFINKDNYNRYVENGDQVLGREENGKSELYVLTKKEADKVESLSRNGMEDALGLSRGAFLYGGYRIDVKKPLIKNLRYSTPEDLGANIWWVPGCRTSNGLYEAVINQVKDAKNLIDTGKVNRTELVFS